MAGILTSLQRTIVAGFILTALLFALLINSDDHNLALKDVNSWSFFFRWLHVISGVMWIGILWYFNFVQIPNMANIPDDQKPAISKVIAPAALWWFRWGAMATLVTGVVLAHLNGYLGQALSLGYVDEFTVGKNIAIGIGMWLGIIMFINVWFIIWPNQKIALGIVDGSADEKAAAGRKAMLFSRTNTMLSIPMLFAMVSAQNIYG
jgi:uncharacterized membrane protein